MLAPNTLLQNRYSIIRMIGQGGMGAVYEAQDQRLGNRVALKQTLLSGPEALKAFEREARILAGLRHPNLPLVTDYFFEEPAHYPQYLVMQYIPGEDLATLLARQGQPFPLERVLDWGRQLLSVLAFLHRHRPPIFHRDIKPSNLKLTPEGSIILLDFGLATGGSSLNITHLAGIKSLLAYTPHYAPLEQIQGAGTDERSDLYALGATLYHLLTGKEPPDALARASARIAGQPDPLPLSSDLRPEIPPAIAALLAQSMALLPAERVASAVVLRQQLEGLIPNTSPAPNPSVLESAESLPATSIASEVPTLPLSASLSPADELTQLQQALVNLETQRAQLGDAVVDAAIEGVRQKINALTPPEQRRRQVTLLFADVSGFTAMSERLDPEDVMEIMNSLWARLDEVITSHGGIIINYMGDGFLAIWGADISRQDDPERAIRAALAMHTALASFRAERELDLNMRFGINTGLVALNVLGTPRQFQVLGDAVNLASRLESAAPVGGVLISHNTYRFVRGLFDVEPLEPIKVKGKRALVQVYLVRRAQPRAFYLGTRGVEGVETRMVGREAELLRLQQALQAVLAEREMYVVTLVGDAGIGKSRLLYEFRSWIELLPETFWLFYGRATQEMTHLPYALLRDVFSFRFEIQDSDPASLAREKFEREFVKFFGDADPEAVMKAHLVGHLIGLDYSTSPHLRGILGDSKQIHDRALHYLSQFFAAASRTYPSLILLEDIQWADEASLDALAHLSRTCQALPLFVLCLARPSLFEHRPSWGEAQANHLRLTLAPLSTYASRQLVREILKYVPEIPPALQEPIVTQAEGNPFYAEELIKMLIERGVIVPGAEQWQVPTERLGTLTVPPTLIGVLQARLDSLSTEERDALQRASIIGRMFWDSAVAWLGQEETLPQPTVEAGLEETLQRLRRRELIYRQEVSTFARTTEYLFKHMLLQSVTYESVLKRQRRAYHARAARWLTAHSGERVGEYAGLIGSHYEIAEELPLAAEWYARAGQQAQATYASKIALEFYNKALALQEQWQVRKRKVEILHMLGRGAEEARELQALSAMAEAPLFEVAYLSAQYHERLGNYDLARSKTERALEEARQQGEIVAQVRCLAHLGLIARRQGDYEGARNWYTEALAMLPEESPFREEMQHRAEILIGLGNVLRQQGQYAEAESCYERALGWSKQYGDRKGEVDVLRNLGSLAYYQGLYNQALLYYRQALEMRRAIGDREGEGTDLFNLAFTLRDLGDYGQAEHYFEAALEVQQSLGNRWEEVNIWNDLGFFHYDLGQLDAAQDSLKRGLALSHEIGDEAGEAYILANLGLVMRDRGDLEGADKHLSRGLELAEGQGDRRLISYFASYQAFVRLLARDFAGAIALATRALGLRRDLGLELLTVADLTTLAHAYLGLGDKDNALEHAQQSLAILDRCRGEGPEYPHHDYFRCYQVLSSLGEVDRARAALSSAHRLLMDRAEKIVDPALRDSFLEQVAIHREIVEAWEKEQSQP